MTTPDSVLIWWYTSLSISFRKRIQLRQVKTSNHGEVQDIIQYMGHGSITCWLSARPPPPPPAPFSPAIAPPPHTHTLCLPLQPLKSSQNENQKVYISGLSAQYQSLHVPGQICRIRQDCLYATRLAELFKPDSSVFVSNSKNSMCLTQF